MVTTFLPAAGVNGASRGWEEALPDELPDGVGILAFQRIGQVDLSAAGGQVLLMEQANPFYLAAPFRDDRLRQGNDAVLFAFAVTDGNGAVLKVNVLDPQAEAGAVEELGHPFADAVHLVQKAKGFVAGEDGGEPLGSFGRGKQDGLDFLVEDFAVEEEDGAEGLVLGGDISFRGEVDQEGLDFGCAHLGGVALVVEEDETPDPVDVSVPGADGIVLEGLLYRKICTIQLFERLG